MEKKVFGCSRKDFCYKYDSSALTAAIGPDVAIVPSCLNAPQIGHISNILHGAGVKVEEKRVFMNSSYNSLTGQYERSYSLMMVFPKTALGILFD